MKIRNILLLTLFISSLAINAQTLLNVYKKNGTVLKIPLNTIDSITYCKDNASNLAVLTTLQISNISSITATSGGNITSMGLSSTFLRGIVWSTSPNPTLSNSYTNDGKGVGSFKSELTDLKVNTTYYVRAYATNSLGTAYGNELTFTTSINGGVVISNPGSGVTFDGYSYKTILLGNGQEWMAENLRTAIYANGDPIPNVKDYNSWGFLYTGAWDYCERDSLNDNPFGKLYNWYTVVDSRNVCPNGWHIPSEAEWNVLIDYIGGETVAGGKLKSTNTTYWTLPNTGATNEVGFNGLPGGYLFNGNLQPIGAEGHWWSTTQTSNNIAISYNLFYNLSKSSRTTKDKVHGCSVRCLKN